MNNSITKIFITSILTTIFYLSDRFENIVSVYESEKCSVFNSFPTSSLPLAIKSESILFDQCYTSIKQTNIKLIDRDNEEKILKELVHQSTLPAENIIKIGDLITPEYMITMKSLAPLSVVKLTSISTGEVVWESLLKTSLLTTYIDELILTSFFLLIYITFTLILFPIELIQLRKKRSNDHKSNYAQALKKLRTGKLSQGVDTLIECAKNHSCKITQDNARSKLREIKDSIGE